MASRNAERKEAVTRGTGNVFADLGFPDAVERQAKLRLAYALNQVLEERRLSQADAAKVLGVTQPKVSALRHYKLAGFSVERLMNLLTALDQDVEIVIRRKPRSRKTGRISVVALTLAICLLAGPAWAQVEVQVRTEKPQFLAGEPIFVILEVKNVGTEQVAYDGASVKPPPELSVRNGERRVIKGLTGCGSGIVEGGGVGGIDHPPMLQPGQSTTFRYLLRGYRLKPGTYELHVSGTVDVAWREPSYVQTGAPRPAFSRSITEPVEGATIDRTLALGITAASQEALRAAYAPYVAAAQSFSRGGREAVNGILEMAPAFLEPEIRTLVKQRGHERGFASAGAQALAEIDTTSSRAELIDWFDRSDDLQIRSSIVNAVARARHPDNLPFLASLLPGRSTQVDNRIRRDAALGIGMIGGEAAVEALRDAPRSPDPLVAGAVLEALGNTRSKSAIAILIERAEGQKGYVSNEVCNALITLTHLGWCGGVRLEETQKKWRTWWAANARNVRIYSPDDCPDRSTLPHIW